MKIIKRIPAVKTFDIPAGTYRAVLAQCKPMTKQSKKGPQEWVRLLYKVKVPEMADQIPCAGRNFQLDLNPGSDLRNFLEVWLGSDFFKAKSNQDLDFDTLVGKEGDISLSHYQGDQFEKPLVIIDNAFPANTQHLTASEPKTIAPAFKQ
jgi:hypothetical protein